MLPGNIKDKLPPYNDEAESATLGALLLNFSGDTYDTVSQILLAEDFYRSANQRVFRAIGALHENGTDIDVLTIVDQLQKEGELDKAGGAAYVASLTTAVPASANVEYYAKIVQDCSIRRNLLQASADLSVRTHDQAQDVREIIEVAEQRIFDINDRRQRGSAIIDIKETIKEAVESIEARSSNKESYSGVPTGFTALDELTGGFQNSEMIIIGARPSIGKTSFALTMAANISLHHKIPCGFFSSEMSRFNIVFRLLALESRISLGKLKTGLLKNTEWNDLVMTAGVLYEAPLYIDDTPNISILDLKGQARRMVRKHGVKIIFVDYIGLVSPEDKKLPRHEQIAEISRSLKSLARELNIPVVALSQVGRQTEGREPKLADLRESGSIEQDADVVMFIHRDREYELKEKGKAPDDMRTKVILAKQRNGPTDMFDILFIPQTTRFENLTYERP